MEDLGWEALGWGYFGLRLKGYLEYPSCCKESNSLSAAKSLRRPQPETRERRLTRPRVAFTGATEEWVSSFLQSSLNSPQKNETYILCWTLPEG